MIAEALVARSVGITLEMTSEMIFFDDPYVKHEQARK